MLNTNMKEAYEKYLENQINIKMKYAFNEEPSITNTLNSLAIENNGKLEGLNFRIKTKESVTRKIISQLEAINDYSNKTIKNEVDNIKDYLRYTIVLDDNSYSKNVISILSALKSKKYKLIGYKNRFKDLFYKDIICHFVSNVQNNKFKFEIQFHTKDSLRAKNITHHLYEIIRDDKKISIEKIIYQIRNAMLEEYNSINEPNNTDIIDKYSHEYLEGETIYD